MRSAFAPVLVPLVALLAALARWWTQGSGNVYTATHKRFFLADPDFGAIESSESAIWLGLEVCALIVAIGVALAVGGFVIRWRETRTQRRAKLLRGGAWVAAVLPLAVPIAAFASGGRPAGGLDQPPAVTVPKTAPAPGITGSIDAPAGRYEVVAHAGTFLDAELRAGGETFDARFTRAITGTWQGDPRDLGKPMTADIRVAAAAVDTGIGDRSKHARNSYLQAGKYPQITLALDQLVTATQDGPGAVAVRAKATLGLIGRTHAVEITGTVKHADAAMLARLGLTGEILVVRAELVLVIKDTALAADAGDFDRDTIPIHVSLVLRHTSG